MNLLITGVSGYLGQAVVQRLIRKNPFKYVFGIDLKPPAILGPVRYIPSDLRQAEVGEILAIHDVDRVMHLAYSGTGGVGGPRDELAVLENILTAAAAIGVERVVDSSRDWVYARSETPVTESALLRKPRGRAAAKVSAKLLLQRFQCENPGLNVVTLRSCPILGTRREARLDRVLSMPWLPAAVGQNGSLQLLHAQDAAEIYVQAATRDGLDGIYNVAGIEPLPLQVVAGILQRPLVRLPRWSLRAIGWSGRMTRTLKSGAIAEFSRGVPLDTTRWLTEGHYRPRYTTRQVLAMWRAGCPPESVQRARRRAPPTASPRPASPPAN